MNDRVRVVPPIVVSCGRRVGPALAGVGAVSGTGVLPEVVVGDVGDLGHGACRCRGAFRGGWGPAWATAVTDKAAAAAAIPASSRRLKPVKLLMRLAPNVLSGPGRFAEPA